MWGGRYKPVGVRIWIRVRQWEKIFEILESKHLANTCTQMLKPFLEADCYPISIHSQNSKRDYYAYHFPKYLALKSRALDVLGQG